MPQIQAAVNLRMEQQNVVLYIQLTPKMASNKRDFYRASRITRDSAESPSPRNFWPPYIVGYCRIHLQRIAPPYDLVITRIEPTFRSDVLMKIEKGKYTMLTCDMKRKRRSEIFRGTLTDGGLVLRHHIILQSGNCPVTSFAQLQYETEQTHWPLTDSVEIDPDCPSSKFKAFHTWFKYTGVNISHGGHLGLGAYYGVCRARRDKVLHS